MIQEDYRAYVAASVGQELLDGKLGQAQRAAMRFSHEAVDYIVRVEEKSGHRAVRSNAPDLADSRARTRRVKGGNGLRRYWDGNWRGDQDGCRRHKLEFPFCEIEWFYTP
jgi:hypothetical protein